MKESYNRDPLVAAAENLMVTEDVAKIQNKVAQLKVGDKTNYGTVKEISDVSITFKAPYTPKTKIPFRQRKMGSADYLLMNLVKLTPDGKGLDKTFKKESNEFVGAAAAAKVAGEDEFEFEGEKYPTKIGLAVAKKIMGEDNEVLESNEFVGAAAAAKVAGEDEFEFEGEKYPTKIGLAVAKKIMGEDNEVLESNEFVGAAAAAKVAGEDEFEFEGEKYPTKIGLAVAKKIMGESFSIEKDITEERGSLKNSLAILAKAGVNGRFPNLAKLAQAIRKNYKAITGETYEDSDQVAMSEVIADLIIHYRLDGEDFIAAWDKTIKEEATELEEKEGEEWYTCETVVKSSGQLYSTFWVKAVDLRDAKKKADKVFKELVNVSFPKGSENKFTLRVKKGDNLGTLVADIMSD